MFIDMDDFEDDSKDKFKKLTNWFGFMNNQFQKIEQEHQKSKLNSLLFDNDIETID